MKNPIEELKSTLLKTENEVTAYDYFTPERTSIFDELQTQHEGLILFDTYKNEYKVVHWLHKENYPLDTTLTDYDSFLRMMHPDDRRYVVNGTLKALKLKEKKKDVNILHCKLMYECSLKDIHGVDRRFHQQYRILELDENGDIRLMLLLINEIGAYKETLSARGMCIHNRKTRKFHALDNLTCLANKEIVVLQLVARGLASDKMALKLAKSIYTINNHRCSILEKLGSNNVAHAVNYGRIMEIIV